MMQFDSPIHKNLSGKKTSCCRQNYRILQCPTDPSEFGLEQPFAKSSKLRTENVASYFYEGITHYSIKLFRRLHFEMLMQFNVIFLIERDQKRFSCIIQQRSITLSIFSSLTPVWWVHRPIWYLWVFMVSGTRHQSRSISQAGEFQNTFHHFYGMRK